MRPVVRLVCALGILSLVGRLDGAQPPVAPVDLSQLSPSMFRDDELDLPFYLAHFHRVANSVALTADRLGFIDIPVWLVVKFNQPHNARFIESILFMSYFFSANRPWNVYRADTSMRARLDAS